MTNKPIEHGWIAFLLAMVCYTADIVTISICQANVLCGYEYTNAAIIAKTMLYPPLAVFVVVLLCWRGLGVNNEDEMRYK